MENLTTKLIPTLTPTFEQWKSLPIYLTQHETSLQRRYGAVKLLSPSRWIPLTKNPYELAHIKSYIKQEIIRSKHHSDVFYIRNTSVAKRRPISYGEFRTTAESDGYRLKDSVSQRVTDYFWSNLTENISLSIPNIDDSLFAKRESVFNMNQLASLLKYYPETIPGVTKPYLHLGMWSNAIGVHIDDHDLISLNYLHHGAPKIWYIIHPAFYSKFEELVNQMKFFSEISSSCLSPLQHKTLLINPSLLRLHGIEYYQIEQKIQELVVIFPGTYHFYFDTGFNISETIKYALPSWLQFQRRSPRLCSCSINSSILIRLNRRFFTAEILNKFQEEYLSSTAQTCIDLSTDEDDQQPTTDFPICLLSPSPTATNTSPSIDITSSLDNPNESVDIWNIFESISSESPLNSTPHTSCSSLVSCQPSPTYSIRPPSYSYSNLRTCINRTRVRRRKCYGCRRQGHLRRECPYLPRQ